MPMSFARGKRVRRSLPAALFLLAVVGGARADEGTTPGLAGGDPPGTAVPSTSPAPSSGVGAAPASLPPKAAQGGAAEDRAGSGAAGTGAAVPEADGMPDGQAAGEGPELPGEPAAAVADPLEPFNRAVFAFNDRFYFWLLRPVAKGYAFVVPEGVRVSVGNFFSNLATPIRFTNSLLQGKLKGAGVELLRFVVNSTIGIGGLFDPARDNLALRKSDEDLGQTLGRFGLGHGFYLVLPVLGPSSARDTVGLAGDSFLDPTSYLEPGEAVAATKGSRTVNRTSLSLGEYEDLTKSAVDPYLSVRDAYVQHRKKKVGE